MTPTTRIPFKIYHEDTDAGGVVYHANYLRYMERARTDWLAERGFDHDRVAVELGVIFLVRSIEIKFLRPGRLGDRLEATARLDSVRHGLLQFDQAVLNGAGEPLARAQVTVVCVSANDFKVAGMPAELSAVLGVQS